MAFLRQGGDLLVVRKARDTPIITFRYKAQGSLMGIFSPLEKNPDQLTVYHTPSSDLSSCPKKRWSKKRSKLGWAAYHLPTFRGPLLLSADITEYLPRHRSCASLGVQAV